MGRFVQSINQKFNKEKPERLAHKLTLHSRNLHILDQREKLNRNPTSKHGFARFLKVCKVFSRYRLWLLGNAGFTFADDLFFFSDFSQKWISLSAFLY